MTNASSARSRISRERAIDGAGLARAQFLVRIQAPAPGEEALAPQDFVDAGNAAGEPVGGIEQGGIGVGQLRAESQQAERVILAWLTCRDGPAPLQQLDGAARPDGPLTEQPS